jgi:Xaa-Pro aminopeptidase
LAKDATHFERSMNMKKKKEEVVTVYKNNPYLKQLFKVKTATEIAQEKEAALKAQEALEKEASK